MTLGNSWHFFFSEKKKKYFYTYSIVILGFECKESELSSFYRVTNVYQLFFLFFYQLMVAICYSIDQIFFFNFSNTIVFLPPTIISLIIFFLACETDYNNTSKPELQTGSHVFASHVAVFNDTVILFITVNNNRGTNSECRNEYRK